jgi:hypothetical protein
MCQRGNCPGSNLKIENYILNKTAEIETGIAEKAGWDHVNRRQKLGLVWRKRKKIS